MALDSLSKRKGVSLLSPLDPAEAIGIMPLTHQP
jgi:hypothetical protein